MATDIDERVTVLIGKNEQGKTTFQRALASLNQGVTYTPKDLPNHLRATLEQKPADQIAIVDAWFTLDAHDRHNLQEIIQTCVACRGYVSRSTTMGTTFILTP